MNGCVERQLSFVQGSLNDDCTINNVPYWQKTTIDYINLNKIQYNRLDNNLNGNAIYICSYDKDGNYITRSTYGVNDSVGTHVIELNGNYKYKISYQVSRVDNLKFYQCNVGIGSMSNELAFGSVNFNDTVSIIIPFIVLLIGFCIGYNLLKNVISKSNGGKTI